MTNPKTDLKAVTPDNVVDTMEEKLAILEDAAEEIANKWIDNAIRTSQNPEQMQNQVLILQFAAINILASCAFNLEKDGRPPEAFISNISTKIREGLISLRLADARGDIEKVGVTPNPQVKLT